MTRRRTTRSNAGKTAGARILEQAEALAPVIRSTASATTNPAEWLQSGYTNACCEFRRCHIANDFEGTLSPIARMTAIAQVAAEFDFQPGLVSQDLRDFFRSIEKETHDLKIADLFINSPDDEFVQYRQEHQNFFAVLSNDQIRTLVLRECSDLADELRARGISKRAIDLVTAHAKAKLTFILSHAEGAA